MSLFPSNINPDLLIAYLSNELDDSQVAMVEDWIKTSEENRREYLRLRQLWELSGQIMPNPAEVATDQAWEKLAARMEQAEAPLGTIVPLNEGKPGRFRIWMKIAAVLLPFLVLAYLISLYLESTETQHFAASELVVDNTLPDGTSVQLNEYSSLSYPKKFAKSAREVHLIGEAFFQVKTDLNKPFMVFAEDVRVEVVGTSFYVKAYPGDDPIEVYVKTGKVILYYIVSENIVDSLVLEPGMKGVFDKQDLSLERSTEVDENQWYWSSSTLTFNKKNLQEVFEVIENAYNVDVILLADSIATYRLTASFTKLPVEQVMKIIAESFKLSVTQNGTRFEVDVASD